MDTQSIGARSVSLLMGFDCNSDEIVLPQDCLYYFFYLLGYKQTWLQRACPVC